MADDKTKLDNDGLDLDLDLDGLDFDSFDPNEKDTRRPATKITAGFLGGVKDLASDANFLRRKALKALPVEYSMAADAVDEATEAGKTLYDTALSEANKSARDARRLGRRVLPRVERFLPDTIGDRVDKYLKDKEADDREEQRSGRGMSKEEQMASGIEDVFRTSLEYDKERDRETRSRDVLKEHLEGKRHTDIVSLQESTAIAVNRMVTYQDTITQRYQRKALELSYRQFFTMRDLLENFKGYAGDSLEAFAKITRNTALPEANKIQLGEMGRQRVRTAIVEGAHERMAGYTRQFRENIMKRMQEQIQSVGSGFRNALDMAGDLAGDGDSDGMGPDSVEMAGGVLGHLVGDWLGNVAAKRVRPHLEKNQRVRDGADTIAYQLDNAPEIIKEWMDRGYEEAPELAYSDDGTKVIGYYDPEGNLVERNLKGRALDTLKRWGTNFIRDSAPRHVLARVNDNLIDSGDDQVVFNKQTRKTINEVIPGYLSRIHHELNIIRTGDDSIQRTVYDYNDQAFTDIGSLRRRVKQAIHPESQVDSFNSILTDFISTIEESGGGLSSKASDSLRKHLLTLAQAGKHFDPTNYAKDNYVVDSEADEGVNAEIREAISQGLLDDSGNVKDLKARRELSRLFKSARSQMPNIEQNILDQARIGNTEVMRDLGFLEYAGSKGRSRGKMPTADSLEKKPHFSKRTKQRIWSVGQIDGDVVDSDGKLIYSPSPKEIRPKEVMSTDNILKSMLSSTETDEAVDSSQPRRYGRQGGLSAPSQGVEMGGVEIRLDLISNGIETFHNTVATYLNQKELTGSSTAPVTQGYVSSDRYSEEHEPLHSGHLEQQMFLLRRGIGEASSREPTIAVVERLDLIASLLESGIAFNASSESAGDGKRTRKGAGAIRRGLGSAIGGIGKFYGKTFSGLGGLLGGAMSGGGNVLRGIGQRMLPGAGKVKDDVTDIYVQGRDSPALQAWKIKAGHYVDQVTGKAITTLDELKKIKGPVIDVSRDNEVVIAVEDIARGVYARGKPVVQRGMSFLKGYYSSVFNLSYKPLKAVASAGKDFLAEGWSRLKGVKDIYVSGEEDPRVKANLLVRGHYYSAKTGRPVKSIKDILKAGKITDASGQVILDATDMVKGLKDKAGKEIKGTAERAWDFIGSATGKVKDFITGSWKLAGKTLSTMANAGKSILDRITGRASGDGGEGKGAGSKKVVDVLKDIYNLLNDRIPRPERKNIHDTDGDGYRDGSWQEQFAARDEAIDEIEEVNDAGSEAQDKSGGGIGKIAAIMKMLGDVGKGLIGLMGGKMAIDGVGDVIAGGKDKSKKGKGRKGKGRGRAKGGRGLLGRAARFLAPAALTFGKGAIVGTAKAGLFLLKGAALAVASPVLLKAAAVTAVVVGGYFLYRKLTDYKPGPLGKVRFAQYGIDTDKVKQKHMKKVRWLETELESKVKISGEEAKLTITSDEEFLNLAKGFGVKEDDEEHLLRWATWFRDRFRPVFLRNCSIAKDLTKKTSLKDLDGDLKGEDKLDYLRRVQFDREETAVIYGNMTTPFDDMRLNMSTSDVLRYIEKVRGELSQKLDGKGKPEVTDKKPTEDDSKVVPTVAIGGATQMPGLEPRENGEAPQDYLSDQDGEWKKNASPTRASSEVEQELDKAAASHDRLSPISLGGGYGGSLSGDPAERAYLAPLADSSGSSVTNATEYAKARREAVEQNAKAVEAQNRKTNDVLNRNMGNVLNVLQRSYDTQRSIDGTLRNINRSITEMREGNKRKESREKVEAMKEQEEAGGGFSFFRSQTKPVRHSVVDLHKEV